MDRLRLPFKVRGQVVRLGRQATLRLSLAMLVALVLAEWHFSLDVSLGLLYILPMVLASTVLDYRQIVFAALACAALRGIFVAQETPLEQALRFTMASIAYAGCGLLVAGISRTRRVVLAHYARLRLEQRLRRRAERQLRLLAQSSPAAILTVASDGAVVAANRAAREMLDAEDLVGQPIGAYLPLLDNVLRASASLEHMRTSTDTWGRRAGGQAFPATTWFSVYGEQQQRQLAAIVVDTSEEVREREYAHFEQLLDYNRLLAGAVSHEIRNLCSAARVVTANLKRHPELAGDPDVAALDSLVGGLLQLASFELSRQGRRQLGPVSLHRVCTELQVIVGPDWADIDGELQLEVAPTLPPVQGERHALLQVLLNLAQNALRAVAGRPERRLRISARQQGGQMMLRPGAVHFAGADGQPRRRAAACARRPGLLLRAMAAAGATGRGGAWLSTPPRRSGSICWTTTPCSAKA